MSPFVLSAVVLFYIGLVLIFLVIVISILKYLQRNHFPKWKFMDFISVGYVEHLYKKYIKRV